MSIADKLKKAESTKACGVCRFYDNLPVKEREAFDAWVAREDLALAGLLEACKEMGLNRGRSQFNEHIRNCHKGRIK